MCWRLMCCGQCAAVNVLTAGDNYCAVECDGSTEKAMTDGLGGSRRLRSSMVQSTVECTCQGNLGRAHPASAFGSGVIHAEWPEGLGDPCPSTQPRTHISATPTPTHLEQVGTTMRVFSQWRMDCKYLCNTKMEVPMYYVSCTR